MRVVLAVCSLLIGLAVAPAPAVAGEGSYHCGKLVYGDIEDKYVAMGGKNGALRCPVNTEADAAGGGRWQGFQGGVIYWTRTTGAHIVWGEILGKWTQVGRERFGYPVTDELTTPDRIGRYNHFTNATSIYWTSATGAHTVYGDIRARWAAMGWERSCLGYPIADETDTAGGGGRTQAFQRGTMYWTPTSGGAHATCG